MKTFFTFLLVALCSIIAANAQTTTVLRVNPDATDFIVDGTTWDSGFATIDDAIREANLLGAVDGYTQTEDNPNYKVEIWVKAGTYVPTTNLNGFFTRQYINVYGGFNGTETSKDQRDWRTHVTTLSPSSPEKPIIQRYSGNAGLVRLAEWDGFTITGSNAAVGSGVVQLQRGVTLRNCIITGNTITNNANGIIYMYPGATVENCIVSNNSIQRITEGNHGNGCGIYVGHWSSANPGALDDHAKIINCKVVNNDCTGIGAIFVLSPYSADIYNTLVANNTTGGIIGGISLGRLATGSDGDTNSNVINCTIVNNVADNDYSAGLDAIVTEEGSSCRIVNCIIAGNKNSGGVSSNLYIDPTNVLVTYTAVENELLTGDGNLSIGTNQFVNPTVNAGKQTSLPEYDWNLLESSICVNAGNNAVVYAGTDLAGNLRIQKEIVDLGAYESGFGTVGLAKVETDVTACYNKSDHSLYFSENVLNITIYNLQGAKVFSAPQANGKITLPALSTGVYLLKYSLGNQIFSQKIIVKH